VRTIHFAEDIRATCQAQIVLSVETACGCGADKDRARLFISGLVSGLKSVVMTIGRQPLWEASHAEILNALSPEGAAFFADITENADGFLWPVRASGDVDATRLPVQRIGPDAERTPTLYSHCT